MKGYIEKIEFIKNNRSRIVARNEHNMVTDAYENIFNQNVMPDALTQQENKAFECYTPMQYLFKGIMLFKDEVDESSIFPTAADFENFVGCGAGYYDGSDAYRGSLNSELTEIDNDKIKLVYDFDLDKANNTIASICLTSHAGGISSLNKTNDTTITSSFLSAYRQSDLKSGECVAGCGNMSGSGVSSSYYLPLSNISKDGYIIGCTEDKDIITCLIESDGFTFKAFEYKNAIGFTDTAVKFNSIDEFESNCSGLIENTGLFEKKAMTKFLETSITNVSQLIVEGNNIYFAKQQSANTYLITVINYDGTKFTSSTITKTTDLSLTLNNIKTNGSYLYGTYTDGSTYYLYVINLSNGAYNRVQIASADYSIIPYLDTVMLGDTSATSSSAIDTRTFYVYTKYGNLAPITIRFKNDSDTPILNFVNCFNAPVIGTISTYNNYSSLNMNIVTPYKATINNLSSAVTKGSINTMRITYIVEAED